MLGSHLRRLADAAEIANLDLSPGSLAIIPTDRDTLLGYYSGPYAACGIEVPAGETAIEQPIFVSATELQALVRLFDDNQEVAVSARPTQLALQSGQRKVSLKYSTEFDTEAWQELKEFPTPTVCHRDDLVREAGFASKAAATALTNPVLTGIRLIANDANIGVMAANGVSLVFQSSMPVIQASPFAATLPAQDAMLALKLLRGEDVAIGVKTNEKGEARSITFTAGDARVRIPLIGGTWPDFSKLTTQTFEGGITIPASSIKALVTAVRIYKADDLAVLQPVTAGDGGIMLTTHESEIGQFQELIPGTLARPMAFDVGDIEFASQAANGDLDLGFSTQMVRLEAGTRRVYVLIRATY